MPVALFLISKQLLATRLQVQLDSVNQSSLIWVWNGLEPRIVDKIFIKLTPMYIGRVASLLRDVAISNGITAINIIIL